MEQDSRLDLYGQLPSLNLYTQISLCYPIPNDDVSCHDIAAILDRGLRRLSKDIPWLAGKIIYSSQDDQHPNTFKIVPHQNAPVFIGRDLRNDPSVPTMQTLRENRFPCRLLDENWLVAYTTFQHGRAGSSPQATVVFALQTNFIKGGVILTFAGHHQAMDMVGLGRTMELLSRACNGDGLTEDERQVANMARYDLVPLIPEPETTTTPQPDKPDTSPTQETKPGPSSPSIDTWPPSCEWAYFSFSAVSLAQIKSVAMETRDRWKQPMRDISTDDALTAFIWKSVSRCRVPRLATAATHPPTKITRAVDMRRYFDLPPEYPGMMQTLAYHESESIQKLHQLPLGVIASQLREAIQWNHDGSKPQKPAAEAKIELPLVRNARELATKIHRSISSQKDVSDISLVEGINPSADLMISSWAKVNECYDVDFGMGLGKPEVVRRPGFNPVEGLVYFLPKRPFNGDVSGENENDSGGEIVVMICLRRDDLERLKGGKEFGKFGEFIG